MPYTDPEKQRAAQVRYYTENRERILETQRNKRSKMRAYIQEVKSSTPCADCGEQFPYYVMQFDHLPEHEKLATIGARLGAFATLDDLVAEIAKCEVVCANCHCHRTFMRRQTGDRTN